MSEQNGFLVECGVSECGRRVAVLPKNIGSVILNEDGATVFASVTEEVDCERAECGTKLGYAKTSRPDSIMWLMATVEAERIHAL